jgi:oxalate decarboxylase/phosphoglucose isomerase-like protein (cupin superfamily)
MITRLDKILGVKVLFDEENLAFQPLETTSGESWEKYLEDRPMQKGIWRSLKIAKEFINKEGSEKQYDFSQFWSAGKPIYYGIREFYNDSNILRLLRERKIRPDVTIIPGGVIGRELNRTEGHEHLSGLPEIYSVIHGKAGFFLFEFGDRPYEIKNEKFVVAEAGEHVLFPPRYAHITVNLNLGMPLVITDLVSYDAKPDFNRVREMKGAGYSIVYHKGWAFGVEANKACRKVEGSDVIKPAREIRFSNGFVLKKGESLFDVPRREGGLEALGFLNSISNGSIYENAYRGYLD